MMRNFIGQNPIDLTIIDTTVDVKGRQWLFVKEEHQRRPRVWKIILAFTGIAAFFWWVAPSIPYFV